MSGQPKPGPEGSSERYIPTPEELEQGVRARKRRESDREVAPESRIPLRAKLFRRGKVGWNRKYVEPSAPVAGAVEFSSASAIPPAPPSAQVLPDHLPDPESEPAVDFPNETENLGSTEPEVQTIRSLKFRQPKTKAYPAPATPQFDPYSPEGRFHASASAKGHAMGGLSRVVGSDNLAAKCGRCGMHGEIMVETEVGGGPSWEHFGGSAIENRCTGDGP